MAIHTRQDGQTRYLEEEQKTSSAAATILIVDDEQLNVDYLEQELTELGYRTVSAMDGREALAKVAIEAPDLILLDVKMPGMDGFTLCRRLKERKETQLIPVVFMTALGERADRIKGIEVGGYDFFTKPPDREVLLARIQNAIEMKHAVDQAKGETVPDRTFRLDGEYWTIAYQGRVAHVRDSVGLHYLAYLLRYPHRKIDVLELVAFAEGPPEGGASRAVGKGELGVRFGLGDAGELLDPVAKAAYKHRLGELREELDKAQICHDLGRVAKTQEEIEFLTQEIARAVGLGGKDRRAASSAERARVNVQRAIKIALDKLAEYHPALGRYLACTITTGMSCSYNPNMNIQSSWRL